MIWMLKCWEGNQPKSGHYMFCQFGHEYWIVSGSCPLEYFDYLAKEPVSQTDEAPFLKLNLYGPFNMFNADHVLRFGPIVAGVTLQGDAEYKASLL
ncbi:hypothetical protein N7486_007956 [Penicillium sp. IBT 16267x]|nr:hypothetical protein N7486_007956 [Penicillium sp. IBT 16267x]